MPIGLGFQRNHQRIGYRVKYFYYFFRRRDLLQKKTSYGKNNKDKIYYVVKPDYQDGVEGLLSLLYRQMIYINYAVDKGYIPFVDWKNFKTQYSDKVTNAWNYFFKQPYEVDEKDVYKSKNVYISGWTFKNLNPNGLFSSSVFFDKKLRKECASIFKRFMKFSDEIIEMVDFESENLQIDNCIGVYVRGTDYVKLRPSGEYVQPSAEQVKAKIRKFVQMYNSPIFLVTEDGNIFDDIKQEFGDRLRTVSFDSYIRDYKGNDVLSKSNVLDSDKKSRGQKYLVKMILLAKCKYIISSMTQGSKFSYILNDGKYMDECIFNLGLYP